MFWRRLIARPANSLCFFERERVKKKTERKRPVCWFEYSVAIIYLLRHVAIANPANNRIAEEGSGTVEVTSNLKL